MPFTAPEPSNRRPRVVGDAVIIGKSAVIAHRYVLQGIWEVDKHHPVALSRLLSMAYGKRISSGSDMVKLLEKAAAALLRNPREADQLISGLPEPLAAAEERVEEANRLLKNGVSPYRLAEALRGEKLGLSPAPGWTERLTLCDKGIVLGKGTVIVALTDDGLDLEGKEGEVLALLSLARRSLAPAETLEKLASVSRSVMAGNISVAAIALAQLGQPPLQDEDLAKSLMFAANRLKRGVKPLELLKKAGFSRATLEKAYGNSAAWDESLHPRDEKGRFGNGNGGASSGSDTSTPAVDGQNLDRSDLTGRYSADTSSTAPGKYSLDQQYAANDTGTKNDASGEKQWKEAWKGQSNEEMRTFLADREDTSNAAGNSYGYDQENPSHHLGRYQISQNDLVNLGIKDDNGGWERTEFSKKYDIHSDDDFLKSEAAQEAAMSMYMDDLNNTVNRNYSQYIGKEFVGVMGEKITITRAGLIAALHRVGPTQLSNYLKTYGAGNTEGKGDNMARENKWAEMRLRLAQKIPYKD